MAALRIKSRLSAEDRQALRRLIIRDSVALLSLFAVTAVLFVLTLLLFRSFTEHRRDLAGRWLGRGEADLRNGHPELAVEALRSALAYSNQRSTEIDLATALAAAGRTQEAIAYFELLHEAEPGNGDINLQLARLSARQGKGDEALRYYQAALDGTWQGDGYTRRREVRLEMTRYLIDTHDYARARTELLIAEGNAPDDPKLRIQIAQMLEQTQNPQDALEIYRSMTMKRNAPLNALEGAGRTAFETGRLMLARDYLERAVADPAFEKQPQPTQQANRQMLEQARRVLDLFPAPELSARERAERTLEMKQIAESRFENCASLNAMPDTNAGAVNNLANRWAALPKKLTVAGLERDPQMEQTVAQLAFDTEKQASAVCGAPTGDDAALLKLTQTLNTIEQR